MPDWNAPPNVHAAMTLRTGGVSEGAYSSFNLATHVDDDENAVQANRRVLREQLQLPSEPIWLEQIHSNCIIEATLPPFEKGGLGGISTADASYSTQAGVVCAVLTADCLPILLCSTDGQKIAAIHGGWRGLAAGIISNSVAALRQDAPELKLIAWLGAAIGVECFAVGEEVRDIFVNKHADYARAFRQHENTLLADIYQLARIELAALGVTQVYGGGRCTVSDAVRFYSYRRDKTCGRMATLIWRSA